MDKKEKFVPYKIPGGKKINLGDDKSVSIFKSYYPDWDKHFYMVPSYLSKRDSLFRDDRGYTGEAEIAELFYQSKNNGIFISNFCYKDENKILQSKASIKFECDFIFVTRNYEMWIIEVRKSKAERVASGIKEKFEQATK